MTKTLNKIENTRIVLGTHNGIDLIQNGDGHEMYYSTKTGKTAMSIRGIARLLGCDAKTISNRAVKLGLGKERQMYTQQGVQGVNLIMEGDLNKLFSAMLDSRVKQETKDSIRKVQDKLVQAGFRLMVLMEVAPEVVAVEAINNIKTEDALQHVQHRTNLHGKYLQSEVVINYECGKNHLKAGRIKGKNNLALELPWAGGRSQMNVIQKDNMSSLQLTQGEVLNKARTGKKEVGEEQKYNLTDRVRDIQKTHYLAVKEIMASFD